LNSFQIYWPKKIWCFKRKKNPDFDYADIGKVKGTNV